jgi:hypothetical protein
MVARGWHPGSAAAPTKQPGRASALPLAKTAVQYMNRKAALHALQHLVAVARFRDSCTGGGGQQQALSSFVCRCHTLLHLIGSALSRPPNRLYTHTQHVWQHTHTAHVMDSCVTVAQPLSPPWRTSHERSWPHLKLRRSPLQRHAHVRPGSSAVAQYCQPATLL